MRVLGTWHLTSLAYSPCKPAEQTWPASHHAHCHIYELCPQVGPTFPLVMGKGLPTGMNRCTKRVYLWLQNLRGRKDSPSRSSWVKSCVSPHTPWLLPPHCLALYTVGCFTPHTPQLSLFFFFSEQNTVTICRLVKDVFEFCKNSNVWGFFPNHTS